MDFRIWEILQLGVKTEEILDQSNPNINQDSLESADDFNDQTNQGN